MVCEGEYDLTLFFVFTAAWCYILPRSKEQNLFISLFAYNLWSYLTILLLLAFFFVTLCYTCSGKVGP